MGFLIKPLKIIAFLVLVITFLGISFCVDLLVRNKAAKLGYFSLISSFYLKTALKVLGVKVGLRKINKLGSGKQNYLIISNHLSYLDVFLIASVAPSVFVANSELEEAFLLGAIIKYSGGVFVERRNRARLLKDMQNIRNILDMGLNVVLFPEGTTSDGGEVKPFKTPLLAAVNGCGVDALPVCIRYRKINGEDIDAGNGHLVYFYRSITFFEHFFRLLNLRSIGVDITELDVIGPGSYHSRKELAKIAFERISGAYSEISTPDD